MDKPVYFEKISTPHGLKYYLASDLVKKADSLPTHESSNVWRSTGIVIEASEQFPQFLTMLILIISIISRTDRWATIITCAGGFIAGMVFRNSVTIFSSKLVLVIMTIYQLISRFFLDILLVFLLTVFVSRDFMSSTIVVVFVSLSYMLFAGSYGSRTNFNNRVMIHYLDEAQTYRR